MRYIDRTTGHHIEQIADNTYAVLGVKYHTTIRTSNPNFLLPENGLTRHVQPTVEEAAVKMRKDRSAEKLREFNDNMAKNPLFKMIALQTELVDDDEETHMRWETRQSNFV